MTKLTRTKRAQVIKPSGIVPMAGLRNVAKGFQETAKLAEGVGDYFYQKGLKDAAKRGMETAYETPSEREMKYVTTGDGLAFADSNGRGIEAEYVTQAPRQDAGLFNRAEALNYNKALATKEKTDTIISAEGTLEQWYLEGTESLDAETFEAKGQAYIQSVIDNSHSDIKGSVAATIQPYFQKRLNAIKVSKRDSDIALAKENTKILIKEQHKNIVDGIRSHGINDRGVQDNIAVLIDLHQSRVGKDYSPEMAMNDVSNFIVNKAIKSDFVSQVKAFAEDAEGFTESDEVEMKKRLASFIEGGYDMTIPVIKDGKISMVKGSVSKFIDQTERTRIANNATNLMNINIQVRKSLDSIQDKFIVGELSKYAAQASLALVDGDMDSLTSAENILLDMSAKMDDPEDQLKVLKTILSIEQQTRGMISRKAAEEKKLGSEAYADQLETSADEMINALTRTLGSNVTNVTGYILDEDDADSVLSDMSTAQRAKLKTQQLALLRAATAGMVQTKSFYETVRSIASGKAVDWDRTKADEFSRMIHLNNEMLKDADGNWNSTEVLQKLGPHFDKGRIPSSLAEAMIDGFGKGVEDPQGMMAAYSAYDRMRQSPAITMPVLDKILGEQFVDALEFMRSSVYDRGMMPNSAAVLNDVMTIRAGGEVKLWSALSPKEKDKVDTHIDEEYEDAPVLMKRQLKSATAAAFKQHGDIDNAISTAEQRVIGGDFGKRWGKSDYSMFGSDAWTQHSVEGNFPTIANNKDFFDKGVLKQINDTAWQKEGTNIYKGEFGFGGFPSKDGGPRISLRFAGHDKAGNPQYLAIPTQVEQGNIVLSDAPLMDKDGNAIIIRPAEIEDKLSRRDALLGQLDTYKTVLEGRVDHILNNPVSAYDLDKLRDRVEGIGLIISNLEEAQLSNIEQYISQAASYAEEVEQLFFTRELKAL